MKTVNTQGGLRKQSECGLWGPAAQVQTLTLLCHSLALGPGARCSKAGGLVPSSKDGDTKSTFLKSGCED